MPAPPDYFVSAMRQGKARRVFFFELDHPSGMVRVFSGLGSYVLDGVSYTGVGGLASVSGLSQSRDVQNNEIVVTLNKVAIANIVNDQLSIRGRAAKLKAAWIDEAGAVIAKRTLFVGVGENIEIEFSGDTASYIARIRGKLVDWAAAPRMYYTDKDQKRLYAGDEGFGLVSSLESASVEGWGRLAETGFGDCRWDFRVCGCFVENLSRRLVGDHTYGLYIKNPSASSYLVQDEGGKQYKERDTDAFATMQTALPYSLQVGGIDCSFDASGDVITAAGKIVWGFGGVVERRIRMIGEITADGTATTDLIQVVTDGFGQSRLARNANSWTAQPQDRIIDNYYGLTVFNSTVNNRPERGGVPWVEATTGAAVSTSGGTMTVGGSTCRVSTTGVVLSPGNRRIVLQGGDSRGFMRVWT